MGFLLIIAIGASEVVSFARTCWVIADWDNGVCQEDAAIASLGGEDDAPSRLSQYVRMPRSIAPHHDAALRLMSECGTNGLRNLVALAQDGRSGVRDGVVRALTGRQEEEAVLVVMCATRDEDRWVRLNAMRALHCIDNRPETRAAAERGLGDEDGSVREVAAKVLGRYGAPSSVLALEYAIRGEPFSSIKRSMEEALAAIRENMPAEPVSSTVPGSEPEKKEKNDAVNGEKRSD
jgi:hypothetical protein